MTTEEGQQSAFPMYNELGNLHAEGLTKREYFACKFFAAIKTNQELCHICSAAAKLEGRTQQELIARMAVIDADALLQQLNPSPQTDKQ